MNTSYPCNYKDCPSHPNYERYKEALPLKQAIKNQAQMIIESESISFMDLITIDKEEGTKFKINDILISVECFICENFQKLDMRKEMIVYQAKEKLKGTKR